MSLLVLPQPVKGILDSRLCVADPSYYPVMKGATSVNTTSYPATGTSTNVISVAAALNSNLIYSRRVLLQVSLKLNITFANASGGPLRLITNENFCLRQFPLASMMSDCRIQMGTQNFSVSTADLIHPLAAISGKSSDWRRKLASTTPSQPDRRQNYADYSQTADNVFGGFNTIQQNYEQSRGAFPMHIIANPEAAAGSPATANTASFLVQLTEPIFMSPFSFAEDDNKGFTGIEQLYMNFTMLNNWARVLCQRGAIPAGLTIGTVSAEFMSNPTVILTSLTPPVDMAVPRSINWDWCDLSYTPSSVNIVAPVTFNAAGLPQGNRTIPSSVMQLPTIPWKLMIYGRRSKTELQSGTGGDPLTVMGYTDTFVPISNVSINFDNKPNLLSNFSQQSLYQISQRNGWDGSFAEWAGYTHGVDPAILSGIIGLKGGILLIDPVLDLSASSGGKAPGVQGNFQLQVSANFYSTSGANINTELIIVPLYKSSMNITAGVVTTRTSCISDKDVIDAESSMIPYHEAIGYVGSGWFDSLKSTFHKFAPMARTLVDGASSLLSNTGHGFTGGAMSGAGVSAGSLEGRYRRR